MTKLAFIGLGEAGGILVQGLADAGAAVMNVVPGQGIDVPEPHEGYEQFLDLVADAAGQAKPGDRRHAAP